MSDITELRLKIDTIDDAILDLLSNRMEIVNQIGILKRGTNS